MAAAYNAAVAADAFARRLDDWSAMLVRLCMLEVGDVGRAFRSATSPSTSIPVPRLGIGFLAIMFGTLIFTHLRARGIYAIIMILSLAVVGLVVHMVIGWTFVWDLVTLVKVHMNLAYYVVVFAVSFILWVYITFIHSRFTYGFVNPG